MFICEDCATERGMWVRPFSLGKCEFCDKTKGCADVYHDYIPNKKVMKDKNGRVLRYNNTTEKWDQEVTQ